MRNALPQNEQFKYLLAQAIVMSLAAIPFISSNWYDVLTSAVAVPMIGAGTYYLFLCNGGPRGVKLLERYMSITWVLFVRYFVLLFVPTMIVYSVILDIFFGTPDETILPDAVFFWALLGVWYFLVGRHIRDVADGAA